MPSEVRPVVVGVDGSDATIAALRTASAEARRRGAPLQLVHVVPDSFPMLALDPSTSEVLATDGARLLAEATATAAAQAPDLEIEAVLRRGGIAAELAAESAYADVLFLGRDPDVLSEQARRANAGAGVAARAGCPVVVVPADWDPERSRGPVVVGLKSPAHSLELLGDGFATAEAQGRRLVVLHAWSLPGVYDDIIVARVSPTGPGDRASEAVERLLRDWKVEFPRVEVEVDIVHARPVRALLEASRTSGSVGVVRRPHGRVAALGGTIRALLRRAACPVRVVAPRTGLATPGPVLERARSLTR